MRQADKRMKININGEDRFLHVYDDTDSEKEKVKNIIKKVIQKNKGEINNDDKLS